MKNYELWMDNGYECKMVCEGSYDECQNFVDTYGVEDESYDLYDGDEVVEKW